MPLRRATLVGGYPLITSSRYRLGAFAAVTLVALRLGIGWHFYQEGVTKIEDPSWTAAGFFTGSVGPLKPLFESMVWDKDGRARLNYAKSKSGRPEINLERTLQMWAQHRVQVAKHFGFDKNQEAASKDCLKRWTGQLDWYFTEHRDDIIEYFHKLDRRDANRRDRARQSVSSLRDQAATVEAELAADLGPWLADVGKIWAGYDEAINAIATKEQRDRGPLAIGKPARGLMDTLIIDRIVPWFDAIVGVMLLLGLGTRIAALAGAGFLCSIIMTQWPGARGAQPVYYQTIEMLGALVLVATAAGQYAGLDFVVSNIWSRFTKAKQDTNS